MERRQFIMVSLSGAAIVALPVSFYCCSDTQDDRILSKPLLLSDIWDYQTIANIGKRYQELYPKENSERKLVELLSKDISVAKNDLPGLITSRIKEDYKTGKIVTIDGWILSITESRQCALFSLTQPK